MPLWKFYHPEGAFSAKDKQANTTDSLNRTHVFSRATSIVRGNGADGGS